MPGCRRQLCLARDGALLLLKSGGLAAAVEEGEPLSLAARRLRPLCWRAIARVANSNGGWLAGRPPGWTVASLLPALSGTRRTAQPDSRAVAEPPGCASFSLGPRRRGPSRRLKMAFDAPLDLADGQLQQWRQRWRTARRLTSWLSSGALPAGWGWRSARHGALRLGGGGRITRPWGARRATPLRSWAAATQAPVVVDGASLNLAAGWRRPSRRQWTKLGAPLDQVAGRRQRRGRRWRTARRSVSQLGGGVPPAGSGWRSARLLALRLSGDSADAGGGGRRATQPRGWVAASLPPALDGAWRAAQPHGGAAAALAPVLEDGAPFSLTAGRWRPSRWHWTALGALFGLAAGQRRRWRRSWRTARRSASWLRGGVLPGDWSERLSQ
jgi:hypothetical protein